MLNVMDMVQLRNGSEETESIVRVVTAGLQNILKNTMGALAFHDLVVLCRDPEREETSSTRMTIDELKENGLVQVDGTVNQSIRNVVLSSAEGEGLEMQFVSPIAEDPAG